jgi:hypothetical protein
MFIFLVLLLYSFTLFAEDRIVITEILKDPVGGESEIPGGKSHEFIEFLNLGPDTFFIKDLCLSDGKEVDSAIAWQNDIPWHSNCCFSRDYILPGQFALILDRDYADAPAGSYFTIADSSVILTVDASSLAGGLTTTKGVFIYKGTKAAISDSVAAAIDPGYSISLGNSAYFTLTVSISEGFSNIPENILFKPPVYMKSPDTLTLGRYEFIQDRWIVNYKCKNPGPASSTVICSVGVLMVGKDMPTNATWEVMRVEPQTVIASDTLDASLYPVYFHVDISKDSATYELTVEEDEYKAKVTFDISSVWLPDYPVKVNEIFPRATAELPEWIELVNTSSMSVNLKNWKIIVSEDTNTITGENLIMQPGSFLVLTKNISQFSAVYSIGIHAFESDDWKSLNNYRDTLKLVEPVSHEACEIACYDSDWFDSWDKQSVERIALNKSGTERDAWVLAEKLSPGLPNPGVLLYDTDKPLLDIGPIPFTPNSDGKNDVLSIRIKHPSSYRVSLEIYGFSGKKLYEFSKPKIGENEWNGRKSDNSHAPVGPFFVVATFTKGKTEKVIRKKGILWR